MYYESAEVENEKKNGQIRISLGKVYIKDKVQIDKRGSSSCQGGEIRLGKGWRRKSLLKDRSSESYLKESWYAWHADGKGRWGGGMLSWRWEFGKRGRRRNEGIT